MSIITTLQISPALAVACSALFGIFNPPTAIGLWVLRFLMLLEIVVMYLCMSVLVECYREGKESRRKDQQCPRHIKNAPMNSLKTKRIVGGDLREFAEQKPEGKHNFVRRWCFWIGATKSFQILERFVYVVLRCFHTPNDQSSATPGQET